MNTATKLFPSYLRMNELLTAALTCYHSPNFKKLSGTNSLRPKSFKEISREEHKIVCQYFYFTKAKFTKTNKWAASI